MRLRAPFLTLVIAVGALAGDAQARLTQADLNTVTAEPPPGARLAPGFGRPAVLIFADVDCGALCDAVLGQTAQALAAANLVPGRDLELVVVGIDPRDDPAAGRDFVARQAAPFAARDVTLLMPEPARLAEITGSLGYSSVYDETLDTFAHPAARYVLAADGRVARVLPAFAADPGDLRRAVVEAGQGRVGGLTERLVLLCYGFDPATGRYSLSIWRATTALAALTAVVLAASIAIAFARERGRRA